MKRQQALTLYLVVVFLLSIVMGLQIITVPWLALDFLGLSPFAVGLIQAAVLVPNVLLLVIGGVSIDRGTLLHKFLWLLILYSSVHIYLLVVLVQGWLSFVLLSVYALLLGSIVAFIQPCKDYIVGSLSGDSLPENIAKNNLSQYFGQAVGIGIAPFIYTWELKLLPLTQVVLLGLAALGFYLLSFSHRQLVDDSALRKIRKPLSLTVFVSGFQFCWQSKVLRSLIAIVSVNGFFHIGVFIVALPLLAKNIYIGDVGFYSLLQGLFILGTIITTVLVIVRGQLDSPGRRVIFSVLYAGLILLGLSAGPTQEGLMFLIFLWGIVVGISANLGRSILQSQALAEYRGRAISIYQFALFGCAPLGALFAGIVVEWWGVLYLLKISAIASFIAFAGTFFTRSLWDIEAEHTLSTK